MRTIVTIGLSAVLAVSSVWAHDETIHKAKATHGTVAAVRGEQLTLTTEDGSVAVMLTDATTVERGEKDVGREALTSGAHVAVFGTKVPGQGLVANDIVLSDEDSKEQDGDERARPYVTHH